MRRLDKSGSGLMMTPMIDIVFQLIAFFIFATSYSLDRPSVLVRPPESQLDGAGFEQMVVLLQIDAQARLLHRDGAIPVSDPRAKEIIDSEFRDIGLGSICVIRADRELPYHVVDDIIEFCRHRGFKSVVLRLQTRMSE